MESLSLLCVVVFLASFITTFIVTRWLIPRLRGAGLVGKDMNKEGHPLVPEMGGLAVVAGLVVGVLLSIALTTFHVVGVGVTLVYLLAALSTIVIMALVGIIDDLFIMSQSVKALLPVFAALPLVAVNAGVTNMTLPFLGEVNFGILFPLLLIPVAITGASNATNMLAGFNGLEAGLGVVMCGTVGLAAFLLGRVEACVVAFAMLGALIAFLYYNRHPSKILIGDVGTLSIGAVVSVSVILGNIEKIGLILILPFFAELFLKSKSGFKADSWCDVSGEKLVCPKKDEVFGLGRLVMYLSDGITESKLVFTLVLVELFFALIALSTIF